MMKKILMTVAVLGCAASIVSAQTVTSANVVGYSKINTTEGDLLMPGVPFVTDTGGTVVEVLSDTLPMGSKVFKYNGSSYDSITYDEISENQGGLPPVWLVVGTNWTSDNVNISDMYVAPAESIFVQVAGAGSGTFESISVGEVITADTVTNQIVIGLNQMANPYPVDAYVTNMQFNATLGDTIFVFNGSSYDSVAFDEISENQGGLPPVWLVVATNWTTDNVNVSGAVIPISAGFWYDANAASVWIYDRPFNLD